MDRIEYIFNITTKFFCNRKIVIYGYNERTRSVRNELIKKGLKVAFFVDRSVYHQKKEGVYDCKILNGRKSEFYVIVPMVNRVDIVKTLREFGFSSKIDYMYLGDLAYSVLRDEEEYFEDSYGNRMFGKREWRSQITFNGFNSTVSIPGDCVVNPEFHLEITDDGTFEIGSGTWINGKFNVFDQSYFKCGNRCAFARNGLIDCDKASISIGDDFTTESNYVIRALKGSSILIGNDCMFSYNVNMRTNDGHVIFDLKTGQNINSTDEICRSRNIKIGDHVWIGMNALILYNTVIQDGSIIGAMSLVKSRIPNNCIAAGVPARVIKKDIAWCRNTNSSLDISECGSNYIKYTEIY